MSATTPSIDAGAGGEQELTDGFHLVIDALKLNGIETIYGVPGIPITDFGRMAQAAGILAFHTQGTTPDRDSVYYYAGIDDARFKKPVVPGDRLEIEVTLEPLDDYLVIEPLDETETAAGLTVPINEAAHCVPQAVESLA